MCDEDSRYPSVAVPPSVYKELASPYRNEDEMDDETISALINEYHLSQEAVLLKLGGSEAKLGPILAPLQCILDEECIRSPTFATRVSNCMIIPVAHRIIFDKNKDYSKGLFDTTHPIAFATYQRKVDPVGLCAPPEDSHAEIGATRADEISANSLMLVNHKVRKEVAVVVWGMSKKRFNLLYVLKDVVLYYKSYCTQNEQLSPEFSPHGYSLLSHISLSLTNDD
ncbi:hypothetical protein J4E85_003670 [Alternaria conjuncta]|uniref:uncharacterized protein n=1 Tax=Alternaria conjuncta TaxID=181017 RepID=UPI00221FA5E0|nr:uncharacterized protein J4E85_003670 [Alternaria conjuncta]KAI4933265.1 hypothetical protein J4E85_003670 [Alternaria conjuncta]